MPVYDSVFSRAAESRVRLEKENWGPQINLHKFVSLQITAIKHIWERCLHFDRVKNNKPIKMYTGRKIKRVQVTSHI